MSSIFLSFHIGRILEGLGTSTSSDVLTGRFYFCFVLYFDRLVRVPERFEFTTSNFGRLNNWGHRVLGHRDPVRLLHVQS